MRVTGLGQCCLDYLGLVESFPETDTKTEILLWKEQGGGPVATALVALSRLGVSCRFYGVRGDDGAGEKIEASLAGEKIDVGGLVTRRGASSQEAFIAIERGTGTRTIFWKRATGEELREKELGEDFLLGADFLLLDGLMAEVSLLAARRANELGIPVMLDAGRVRKGMLEIAALSDYLVASGEFAADLGWDPSGGDLPRAAERFSCKAVTVTLGSRGSVTWDGRDMISVPAFEVDVADTTGAGDVFHGGYIFGLLKGWDIRRTVIFASALAAMKCREIGGRSGIPGIAGVLAFLGERGYDYRV